MPDQDLTIDEILSLYYRPGEDYRKHFEITKNVKKLLLKWFLLKTGTIKGGEKT